MQETKKFLEETQLIEEFPNMDTIPNDIEDVKEEDFEEELEDIEEEEEEEEEEEIVDSEEDNE